MFLLQDIWVSAYSQSDASKSQAPAEPHFIADRLSQIDSVNRTERQRAVFPSLQEDESCQFVEVT